jgi:signal transduction histidine kinase/ActR/RegA family two-component response regulator/HAMP domain-containing protein
MAIMLLTSGSTLLLTCSGFFAYDYVTFRRTTVRQLETVAGILASNSTAALAFRDRGAAQEILRALEAETHVVAAGLYDREGSLFSTYPAGLPAEAFPPSPERDGYRFVPSHLLGFHPVSEGDSRLGTLYIRSDLKAMSERLRLYGTFGVAVAGISSLLAYLMSRILQRQVSAPILTLAETARRVSEDRDYSVRAAKTSSGEIGLLTDAFNHMLTHIQEQLAKLELLNRITRAIGERMELSSIYKVMAGTLEDNLPVDFACVCLYEREDQERTGTGRLTVTSVGPKSAAAARDMSMEAGEAIPIDQNGLSRCVNGELVHEPDISGADFPFPRRLAARGFRSLVISPLAVESRVFGVLVAARRRPEAFNSLDCEFLRQLSEQAALAAHQAGLYGELRRAYEDLRQSQQTILQQERLRALGQMASGIAHDINNAISPVSLYTEFLLEKETGLSPRAREHLQVISHAIEDVAATVARMKEFYRQREQEIDLAPVQVNRCVQQVIGLTRARWQDMAQQRGSTIAIETDLEEDLPEVMCVEGEIREALTNLYLNAFDAMPEGGTLTVRTRAGDGQVRVEVADTGIGMDEETRRRCLEPFYTTKGERGTGLGLAMVYGMARRHSADVEIESAPGKGTTIRLVFAAPSGLPPARQDAPQEGPLRRLDILVVDDDPLLLKSLDDALTGDGHAVAAANGGQAGIDLFRSSLRDGRMFDLVVTDLGMPYLDGRKVAAAIKGASPGTPVILLTGWGHRLITEGDIPPNVDRVLAKPPKLSQLREAFADCLQTAKEDREG